MKSLNLITFIIILSTYFIGDNVLTTLGIQTKIHKLCLILLCLIPICNIIKQSKKIFPQVLYLAIFITFYLLFKIATSGSTGNTQIGIMVLLPVLIFMNFLSQEKFNNFPKYKLLLYTAFIFECTIAILERILYINVFKLDLGNNEILTTSDYNYLEFRSIGLYGHPLQNSLIVFIFILFILVYESNIVQKFTLSIIGIISIFCFNSRAAIVISISCFGLYLIYWLATQRKAGCIKMLAFLCILIACVALYKLYTSGIIGGRLASFGLYDEGSASVRVNAWSIFNYYDISDFLLGINSTELDILKYRVGLHAIENFWLNWVLSYGLLFVIGLVIFYIPVIKRLFRSEHLLCKIFIIIPFITLASTNPSLAVSIIPMTTFLLLSYIMPKIK